jgi:tetratricopeptide (TPR) repeat protein
MEYNRFTIVSLKVIKSYFGKTKGGNMRRDFFEVLILAAMAIILSCGQKPTDLTFTTNSSRAREYYAQGLDKAENFFFAEARDLFAKAVKDDPNFAMAYYQWAQVSTNTEDFLKRLDKAVELVDKVPEVEKLVILSAKAQSDGDNSKTLDYLNQALKIYPNGKRLRFMLANYYYGMQDFTNAEKEYRQVIAIDPKFAPPYNILAYLLSGLNRYDESIVLLQKYAELRPKDPNPHDSMGEIYLYQGKHDLSIKEYGNSLGLDSTFVISLAGLGHNHVFMGDYIGGRAMYDQIKARADTTADTNTSMFWTATSYCHEGKFDLAIKTLEQQIAFDQAHKDIYMEGTIWGQLGEIYRESGDPRKAIETVARERQIAAIPNINSGARQVYLLNATNTEAISYAKLGIVDSANIKLGEAAAIVKSTPSAVAVGTYNALEGIIAFYTKDYTKALEKLAMANSTDPVAKYYRAMSLEAAGKSQDAAEAFANLAAYNHNSLSYGIVRPWAMAKIKKA